MATKKPQQPEDETTQRPVPPTQAPYAPAKTADEVLEDGEETVTMVFPNPVTIMTSEGQRVSFDKGVQEVPKHLADHSYLKSNGVKAHERKPRAAAPKA